jgi:hypothetical protein
MPTCLILALETRTQRLARKYGDRSHNIPIYYHTLDLLKSSLCTFKKVIIYHGAYKNIEVHFDINFAREQGKMIFLNKKFVAHYI